MHDLGFWIAAYGILSFLFGFVYGMFVEALYRSKNP